MKSSIYKIECATNGSFYFGRTINFEKRKNDHLRDMRNGIHKNDRIQNCYNKYGEESIVFSIVETVSREKQIGREQYYLDKFINNENCLNINRTAETFCDVPWTEERKRKISESATGRKLSPKTKQQREHMSKIMMGHVLSEETKNKISIAHTGKKMSNEQKDRYKVMFSGENNPRYGKCGAENPVSKKVAKIDMKTFEIIETFESGSLAAQSVNCDRSSINKICKRQHGQIKGFFWCYVGEYEEAIPIIKSKKTFKIKYK